MRPSQAPEITVLNGMAGVDFATALDCHVDWSLRLLDLKEDIFGKAIAQLSEEDADRARDLIAARGLSVHCFSSALLHAPVERGEAFFRKLLEPLESLFRSARILQPTVIRLLSASTEQRAQTPDAVAYVKRAHPWLLDIYREAVDRIEAAGFVPMIENEVGGSIFSTPDEIICFFNHLDRPAARLIWDIGNLWQMGTFPTLTAYERLRPWIGSIHLKGGQSDAPSDSLRWASSLEDSSWPVGEFIIRAIADGIPVLCINPPHGGRKSGYDYDQLTHRDVTFVQRIIREHCK